MKSTIHPVCRNILLSYLSSPAKTGRPRSLTNADLLEHISYVLRTGCQWRYLPVQGASWQCVYAWFSKMSKDHVFEKAYKSLLKLYLRRRGGVSKNIAVDTSFVKNVYGRDCTGKSYADRGRKATKVSAMVDDIGVPLQILFHPGNKYDGKTLNHLLEKASKHVDLHDKHLYGDKAYGSAKCFDQARFKKAIPRFDRRKIKVPRESILVRLVVEHAFGWLDKYRRIILRYDALVCHFRSFHFLACMNLAVGKMKW